MTDPVVAQGTAAGQVEAGKTYFWCACGKKTENNRFVMARIKGRALHLIKFTAEADKKLFCGCKTLPRPHFVTGHTRIADRAAYLSRTKARQC